ncbi:exonuclease domain-containing protein [Erythrobacter sp. Dej080120_24]|uniref:exonuclease domain-containing protein n=1 Tax=Erythrobacter sp. Dej080120_24 TaxID=3024837 RepID=UPI0030C74FE8
MWRQRLDGATEADGRIAKKLRNAFVAQHCRAVWVVLPDTADIGRLEAEVIAIAPAEATAWNGHKTAIYDEPLQLVDETIRHLGWGERERAALERQRQRSLAATGQLANAKTPDTSDASVPSFPKGPFRFVALDVETANNDRSSICQIGVACVRPDNSIASWKTYIDPQVRDWHFTGLHGISAHTVSGAPVFAQVIAVLNETLRGVPVYQHSSFDRSSIAAACHQIGLSPPSWNWRDSIQIARKAWPELQGNGGYGLANLKSVLSLSFDHHDAGEDARAAAQVVLLAEQLDRGLAISPLPSPPTGRVSTRLAIVSSPALARGGAGTHVLGEVEITQANIDNSHIYLRGFFDQFPTDAIGGSNKASVAPRQVSVDYGGGAPVMTDLDGSKKFFRNRALAREFFLRHSARVGDFAVLERLAPYQYRIRLRKS